MCQKVCTLNTRFRLSLSFGLFQFFMPLVGFYAGLRVARFIESIDHWIVFMVLSFVGGKMIYDALSKNEGETMVDISQGIFLLVASIATSIDSLAVGFSFALLKDGILFPAFIIGVIASIMTFVGVTFGYQVGRKYISNPEVVGGIAIILIGLKFSWSTL
ncbi:MAG: manganese efflux pump [Candidatus Atribacteria bacterium]|nr:manganese efflux pump [Candidatus Atribacteria bacterium]